MREIHSVHNHQAQVYRSLFCHLFFLNSRATQAVQPYLLRSPFVILIVIFSIFLSSTRWLRDSRRTIHLYNYKCQYKKIKYQRKAKICIRALETHKIQTHHLRQGGGICRPPNTVGPQLPDHQTMLPRAGLKGTPRESQVHHLLLMVRKVDQGCTVSWEQNPNELHQIDFCVNTHRSALQPEDYAFISPSSMKTTCSLDHNKT